MPLAHLLRGTLKVVGSAALNPQPAAFGIFYVNETSPLSGGAGHTIRVCQKHCIPVPDQKIWMGWDFS